MLILILKNKTTSLLITNERNYDHFKQMKHPNFIVSYLHIQEFESKP